MTNGSTVELHPAHVWTCDDCGRDNFCRGVVVEMDEETKSDLMEVGVDRDDLVTGFWMTNPDSVTCGHCGSEFEVEKTE